MMPCSIERLQSALAGSLPVDDEAALCRHLDECDACGAELERLAASDAVRAETIAVLTDDEWDADVPTRDDWSPADFTVEHLDPSDEPNVLGRLGGYDVLEIVGRGGMGVVLKAFDRDLKRCVAIKVLAPHLAQSSLARKRFAREARAAAAVVHANVLAIHHVQPTGRLPFLVMPLVAGESLAHRIASQGTLSLEETLRIGMQAAAGLAAAHEQGLVHRDVKPANILLEKGVERAVLMDFGLARAADDVTLTRRGIISGTPQYMSPEQARGEPLDGRSDLFSLGCVLYEMATGVSPFRTDSMLATLRRLVDDAPRPLTSLNPELPGWFVATTDRLLEKDTACRFGSAKEVSETLEACLAHLQQPGVNPLPPTLSTTRSRSGRRLIGFRGVLTMLAALGACLFGGIMLVSSEPDIAGTWSGEDWGDVVLKKTESGRYEGTYTDTFGKTPGAIRLSWSRIERRFNGTWREGDDRFGDVSVRLVGKEIHGAFTTDTKAKINPATPALSELTWVRAKAAANRAGPTPPGIAIDEHGDVYSVNLGQASGPMVWGPVFERTIVGDGRDCWALNLASSKVVTSTPKQPLDFRVGASDVLRAAKVDLYSPIEANTSDTLIALDMCLVPLGATPDDWDMSTSETFARLDKAAALMVRKAETLINGRKVFAFRTRDGSTGLLKISESREDVQRVKTYVRYKLVQKGPPTVELVALAKYPTDRSPWWTPEGRLLKEPPVDASNVDLRAAEAPEKNWYAALFRVPGGLDSVVSVVVGDAIHGSGMPSIWMGRQTRNSEPVDDLAALAIALPASATHANLAVQVARGTWQTIAAVDGKQVRDQDSGKERSTAWKVIDRKDRLRLFVNYPKADTQIRVAFQRGGGTTFARLLHPASPDDASLRVEAQFPGLVDLTGDCSFIVQTRAYEKFEFGSVALSPIESPQSKAFGPVMERVVNDPQAPHEKCAIDLDSGNLLPLPASFTLKTQTDSPAQRQAMVWARNKHVDAVASITMEKEKLVKCGLLGSDLLAIPVDNKLWDQITTTQLTEQMKRRLSEWGFIPEVAELTTDGKFPATYLIQTRAGRMGILQITGSAENPRGVKIRYKLIQDGQSSAEPSPKLTPASVRLLATKERAREIDNLIKLIGDATVTANALPKLFELTPGSKNAYRLRSGVVSLPIMPADMSQVDAEPLGRAIYWPDSESFYLQWGGSEVGMPHYYGPFHGKPGEKLGLKQVPIGAETKQAGPLQESKAAFGPVIERVVPFSVPGTQHYFQFRTGRIMYFGSGLSKDKERAAEDEKRAAAAEGRRSNHCYLDGWSADDAKWVEAEGGVDVLATNWAGGTDVIPGKGEERFQFIGQGCVFTDEHEPNWDKQTAGDTLRQLQLAANIVSRLQPKRNELPATYLFKTARGDAGVVQLLGIAEDQRGDMRLGVRLRYKLIQPATDARPEAKDTAK